MNPARDPGRAAPRDRGWAVVADDDPALRSLCERALRTAGYATCTAASGPAALEIVFELAVRGERIEVIVVDQHMPLGGGQDVVTAIRRRSDLANLAIVMISGGLNESSGTDAFVAKPFPTSVLLAAVDDAQQRRRH